MLLVTAACITIIVSSPPQRLGTKLAYLLSVPAGLNAYRGVDWIALGAIHYVQ